MNKIILVLLLIIVSISAWADPFLRGNKDLPDAPKKTGRTIDTLVQWQKDLRSSIHSFFKRFDENKTPLLLISLFGAAFIYGIIHAAGPGHRKTIVFTMFLGRKSKRWEPLSAGFFSAGLHGGTSLILILILYGISKVMISFRADTATLYLEGITYIVLFALTLVFFVLKILEIAGKKKHHHHSAGDNKKSLYSTLAATSLFPCPGAIMILVFSITMGQLLLGIFAILFLSAGMGVTISASGYLAFAGRKTLFYALKNKGSIIQKISLIMEAGAFLFLALFSLWAVLPFITSL